VSYHTSLCAADYFCLVGFDGGFFFGYNRSSRALELPPRPPERPHPQPLPSPQRRRQPPRSSPSLHLDERDIAAASIHDVLADVRSSAGSESLFWTGHCCPNVAGAAASSALIDAWTNLKEEETNDDMISRKHNGFQML
jgi:hypothetical protein